MSPAPMLNLEDTRSWFAIAALATALVFLAGSADGTLRCGHYAGRAETCFADPTDSAAKVFRQMADERSRCSYFEPACSIRSGVDQKEPAPALNTGAGYPAPRRGVNVHAPQRGLAVPARG